MQEQQKQRGQLRRSGTRTVCTANTTAETASAGALRDARDVVGSAKLGTPALLDGHCCDASKRCPKMEGIRRALRRLKSIPKLRTGTARRRGSHRRGAPTHWPARGRQLPARPRGAAPTATRRSSPSRCSPAPPPPSDTRLYEIFIGMQCSLLIVMTMSSRGFDQQLCHCQSTRPQSRATHAGAGHAHDCPARLLQDSVYRMFLFWKVSPLGAAGDYNANFRWSHITTLSQGTKGAPPELRLVETRPPVWAAPGTGAEIWMYKIRKVHFASCSTHLS